MNNNDNIANKVQIGGLKGYLYQVKLLMLVAYRGLLENLSFYLGTEIAECNKFDDAVIKLKKKDLNQYYFIQAKHRSKVSDEIKAADLFTNKDVDFGLVKYVNSWIDLKNNALFRDGDIKYLIVYTNINFNLDEEVENSNVTMKELLDEIATADDEIFKIINSDINSKIYRFKHDLVLPILEPLIREYNVLSLAKKIVTSLLENKPIRHEDSFYKKFHIILTDTVFNVKTKMFHDDFIDNKKFEEKYANDEMFSKLRSLITTEIASHKYTLENIHRESGKKFNLSKGFGTMKKEKEQQWNTGNMNLTEEKFEKAGNLCVHNSQALAKKFAKCLINRETISKDDHIFKHYDSLIVEDIIDMKSKTFRSEFIEDPENLIASKFDEKKYYGLRIFKDSLKSELGNNSIPLKYINDYIQNGTVELKISENFGDKNKTEDMHRWPEISKQEIEECLNKIIFATNQHNETELDQIVQEDIYKEFPNCDLDLIASYFLTVMINWMKGNKFEIKPEHDVYDVRFISSEDIKKLFIQIKRKVKLEGPTLNYYNKIIESSIQFDDLGLETVLQNFLDSKCKILNITSTHPFLSSLKVFSIIDNLFDQKDDCCIFEKLSSILNCSQITLDEFGSKICHHLLIIECDLDDEKSVNINDLCNHLIDVMKDENKKLILTSQINNIFFEYLKSHHSNIDCISQIEDKRVNFCDLSSKSQIEFSQKKKINFQGYFIQLKDIVDDNSQSFIDSDSLLELINNETIELGEECLNTRYSEHLYIDRVFRQKIQLTDYFLVNVSTQDEEDFYMHSPNENINEISISKLDRNQVNIDKSISHFSGKTVHYFKTVDKTIHIDSSNNQLELSDELKCKICRSMRNKIVLVDAEAGMGKTTIFYRLSKMIKKQYPSLWVSCISLVDISLNLKELQKKYENLTKCDHDSNIMKISITEVIQFLMEILSLKSSFEKNMFKYYLDTNKVVLLFDGFDEISPTYKDITISIIKTLHDQSEIRQIWISTRPYEFILDDLIENFNVSFYFLEPFTKENQLDLFERIWTSNSNNKNIFHSFAEELLKIFSEHVKDVSTQFLGIALHTMMVATTFKEDYERFVQIGNIKMSPNDNQIIRKKMNLSTLYENFLNIKYFHVFCKDKCKMHLDEEAAKKRAHKDFEKIFLKENRSLSLDSLFDEDQLQILLSKKQLKEIAKYKSEILEQGECTGIVNKIISNKPNFVHKTYAEYFAADWFVEIFNEEESRAKEILRFFLVTILKEEHSIICSIFNSKLNDDIIEIMNNYDGEAVIKNECDKSLLNFTVKNGWLRIAKYLVENGVKSDIVENSGKTIYTLVCEVYCAYEEYKQLFDSMEKHYDDFHHRLIETPYMNNMSLIHAMNYQNYNCIRALWEKFIKTSRLNVNEKESIYERFLHYATVICGNPILRFLKHFETAKNLLDKLVFDDNSNCGLMMSKLVENDIETIKIVFDMILDSTIIDFFDENGNENKILKVMFFVSVEMKNNNALLVHLINRFKHKPKMLAYFIYVPDKYQQSTLTESVKYGHYTNLKLILELAHFLNINMDYVFKKSQLNEDDTLLHMASKRKNDEILILLIERLKETPHLLNEMLVAKNRYGETPIYSAVREGHQNNIQILFNILKTNNIDIDQVLNTIFQSDMTFLHAAVLRKGCFVLNFLLEILKNYPETAKKLIFSTNKEGKTPLLYAARASKDKFETVFNLIESYDVDIEEILNMKDRDESTVVHLAAENSETGVLKYLLSRLSTETIKKIFFTPEKYGFLPIHLAVISGFINNVKLIFETFDSLNIDMELAFNTVTVKKYSLLHLAAEKKELPILQYLLNKLKNNVCILKQLLISKNIENLTPLHLAAITKYEKKFFAIFDTMKSLNIDIKEIYALSSTEDGDTLFHDAARRPFQSYLITSIEHFKDNPDTLNNLLLTKNKEGKSVIHIATENKQSINLKIIFDTLISNGVEIIDVLNLVDNNGRNLFHYAAYSYSVNNNLKYLIGFLNDNSEMIKKLFFSEDESKHTVLHSAADRGHEEHTRFILSTFDKYNIDFKGLFSIVDNKGETLLHLAAKRKWTDSILIGLTDRLKDDLTLLKNLLSIRCNKNLTPIDCAKDGYKTNESILSEVSKLVM